MRYAIDGAGFPGTVPGGAFRDVSEKRRRRRAAIRCMKECIDAGHAVGITFVPVQGKDIRQLGVPPITDRIVEGISRLQGGQLKAEAGNIRLFDELL